MTAPVTPSLQQPLVDYVLALADDELLLGHRDAEWTGLGPILEEDIAFSSMAQDEMGHAVVWYELLHSWGQPDPDTQAYLRDAPGWRNARLFELPRGDYAFSLVRQYLADLAQAVRYDALVTVPLLTEAAVKLRQEEKYHLLHGRTLLARLAAADSASRARLQTALDELFPYALGVWEATRGEDLLVAEGVVPASAGLGERWLEAVVPFLESVGLHVAAAHEGDRWAATVPAVSGGRQGEHGSELTELLGAMQSLRRSEPEAVW